jgi:hypothetical protein
LLGIDLAKVSFDEFVSRRKGLPIFKKEGVTMDKRVLSLVALAGASAAFAILGFGCGSPLSGSFNGTISFTQMNGGAPITTNLTGTCQNGTSCTFNGNGASATQMLQISTSQCNGGIAQITGGTFTQYPLNNYQQQPTSGTMPVMATQCQTQIPAGGTVTCNSNLQITIPLFQMGTQQTTMMGCQGQITVTANRI